MYLLLPFQEQEQETAISPAYPQPLGVSLDGYDYNLMTNKKREPQILRSGNSFPLFPLNHNTNYSIVHMQVPPLTKICCPLWAPEIKQMFLSST